MAPTPAPAPLRRRPRNWHSASEQRRLFWILLPLVLVAAWLERVWLGPPAVGPSEPIDTVLSRGPVTRTIDDGITIEPSIDSTGDSAIAPSASEVSRPADTSPSAAEPLAAADALALVRDDTVFRSADQRAWFSIWERLREEAAAGTVARGREVTFSQVFSQPRSFRGRRVRVAGTIRRLQEVPAPANPLGIAAYWQAWLEPAGGPAAPIVVYFLALPPGTPTGMRVEVPAIVDGVFFKRWAYQASDAIRLAPLLMAIEPRSPPRITSGRGSSPIVGWALGSIVGLLAVTWLALRLAASGPRRRHPDRLDADLDGVSTADPREALRRLESSFDGVTDPEPPR